ncbi:hypothetical protein BSKO_03627 [Bryopsis sp. KO-2023]|nr:hypothetical protein BSKO_03627 [Bryopsis sp. KO-2023]
MSDKRSGDRAKRGRHSGERFEDGGDMVGFGAVRWAWALNPLWSWLVRPARKRGHDPALSKELLFPEGTDRDTLLDVSPEVCGVTEDGGVEFDILFVEAERLSGVGDGSTTSSRSSESEDGVPSSPSSPGSSLPPVPHLDICIMVVGTRGDVQPFIALGRGLKDYGHRVRLASHSVYRDFVLSAGLEFYPLGGDPKVMIELIVKNRSILPQSIGDVQKNREQLKDIVFSTFDACIADDPDGGRAFQAQAIIANPPCYGHIHCAERLGIPLHMVFTMPWTRTVKFVNPHARISDTVVSKLEYITGLLPKGRAERWNKYVRERMNWFSFIAVEDIVCLGIKDIIDQFRAQKLGLDPLPNSTYTRHLLDYKRVPFTYCWSPSLVPKPCDWGEKIDVVGFFFFNQMDVESYEPPQDLIDFLEKGPPPVYIGFGSMVVANPDALMKTIIEAVEITGLRVIVSRGWGGLGAGDDLPDSIFVVGNCPHDWLFSRCEAVVHHGGAGTTAAGLLAACPTLVVPFFGDQPFWGESCYRAGVGPEPIPIDQLDTKRLVYALGYFSFPRVKSKVKEISEKMKLENGVEGAIEAFHRHLPRDAVIHKRKMLWNLSGRDSEVETSPSLPEVLPPRKLGPLYWLWGWMCCHTRGKRKKHRYGGPRDASSISTGLLSHPSVSSMKSESTDCD